MKKSKIDDGDGDELRHLYELKSNILRNTTT